jgi:hypothetical protein
VVEVPTDIFSELAVPVVSVISQYTFLDTESTRRPAAAIRPAFRGFGPDDQ